jgi:curved DNA-binding protein CbpA
MLGRDAYDVLQVSPDADDATLRKAYRALARRFHPDGSEPDRARMVEINAAYEQVQTTQRRAAYDRGLRREGRSATAPGASGHAPLRWTRSTPTPPSGLGPLSRRKAAAEHADTPVIDFGLYAGWRIGEVAQHDPDYLRWLSRHSSGVRFQDAIRRALPRDPHVGRPGAFVR